MAELRLPRFLSDKGAETREIALVRFAEENDKILTIQTNILIGMNSVLKSIENMTFLSLDYEKRKMAMLSNNAEQEELKNVEATRESENDKQKDKGGKFSFGSLATAAAKIGIKGMIGAYLLGFGLELLGWGKVIGEWKDKLVGVLTTIQDKLNEWGDELTKLTGSEALGGIVKSLLFIGSALAGLRIVFGPKIFEPIKMLFRGLGKLMGVLGDSGKMLEVVGKFGNLFKIFGRIFVPLGILISVVEGIWGAFKGFQEGYKDGGFLNGIKEGFIGLIDGLVGGLIDMFSKLLGWILEKLGFDDLSKKFKAFNFKAFFGSIIDEVQYAFEYVWWMLKQIPNGMKNMLKSMIDSSPKWVKDHLVPDSVIKWANSGGGDGSKPPVKPEPRKATVESSDAPEATVSAEGAGSKPNFSDVKSSVSTVSNAPSAPAIDPNTTSDLGSPASTMTGGMNANTAKSARVGANQSSGGMTFDQAVGHVLTSEGGYVNDPTDPGGETKFGISKRAYPNVDIKGLTLEKAKAIYKHDYWDAIGADDLPANIRYAAFDAAVNNGVGAAKKMIKESGGDLDKFIEIRRAKYASIIKNNPKMQKYAKGWSNRLDDVASASRGSSPSAAPASAPSGSSLASTSTEVASMSSGSGSSSAPTVVAPSNSKIVNNNTHNAAQVAAATPVEFAPHVV